MLSVNRSALRLVRKLFEGAEEYGVNFKKTGSGSTLIDAGIKAKGGFLAGKIVTEICLGGLGKAEILNAPYGDLILPSIFVYTDHPAVATLGSQLAGWPIKAEKYFAMGSGPARALALKPKELYEKMGYRDEAEEAVLVLETSKEPPEEVITYISNQCRVKPDNLSLILAPTSSTAGSMQISGRVVEQGIYRLMKLGLDPRLITHGWGYAPIAPIHPEFTEAMGRTNDALLYAGVAGYTVNYDDDETLKEVINKAPSSSSKSYGRPFVEIFKEAKYDFYQIDHSLFAPAFLIVNNAKTGKSFKAGKINLEVLMKSLGL
jgi:methenyltetrahydromethanopterin cyclohydrolase